MTATPPPSFGGQLRLRLVAMTAAIVALTIIAVSVVTWGAVRLADPRDGTVAQLLDAPSGGAWQAVTPQTVISEQSVSPGEAIPIPLEDDAESWVVQVTVTAGLEPLEVSVRGADVAFLEVQTEQTASATTIVRNDPANPVAFVVTGIATMSVETVARFTPPDEMGGVGPGGSVAIAPVTLLDSERGIGPEGDGAGALEVSVLGIGDVPPSGVQAVWLSVVLEDDLALALPSGADDVTVLPRSREGAAQGLVLVPLDTDGRIALRFLGSDAESHRRLSVVGWVAAPGDRISASLIEGGVVAGVVGGVAADGQGKLPAFVPEGAVALWTVSSGDGEGRIGARVDDRSSTTTTVRGSASALVASLSDIVVNGDVDLDATVFMGFVNSVGRTSDPIVAIETPRDGISIDLVESQGSVTFSGTVDGQGAGIARIDLRVGGRFIGTAPLRIEGEEIRWRLSSSAPPGSHVVTAVATTLSGDESSAAIEIVVNAPVVDGEALIRPDVVVLDEGLSSTVLELRPDRVVVDAALDIAVGDTVVAGSSAAAPEGLLRRVVAIEIREDRAELRTVPAGLDEVFISADVSLVDVAVDPATKNPATPLREADTLGQPSIDGSTARAPDALPSFALAADSTPAASGSPASFTAPLDVASPLGDQPNDALTGSVGTWELRAQLEVESAVDADGNAAPPSASLAVSSVVNDVLDTTIDLSVNTDLTPDESIDGVTRTVGASVAMSRKFALFYTFILEINVDWKWLNSEVSVSNFETSMRMETTDTTDLAVYGAVEYSSSDDPAIGRIPEIRIGGPVTFSIGPVPVVLTFSIVPTIEVSLRVSAETTMRIRSSESITVGVRVVNDEPSVIAERSNQRPPVEPLTAVAATLTTEVGLGLRVKAYETLSVTIGLAGGLELTAEALLGSESQVSLTLMAYLELTLSAGLTVLGVEVLEWEASQRLYGDVIWSTEVGAGATSDALGPPGSSDVARGDGERLLVVVVDVSGSMGGERIEEAKASLNRVVREQQPGAELGIWTYPGGGGCDPGTFTVPPAARAATGELLDIIDGLGTGGNTPTGEALRQVTNQLIAEGRAGATLLLVSDGESNCGPPPCDVANEIRSQGFDLTVQSVGFQISEAGRNELACIAQTTGGQSFDVQDADELWPLIESLSQAELAVEATVPSQVRSGASTWVTVTVRNPSARDVTQASAIVTVEASEIPVTITPTALLELGNIPAGGEISRRLALSVSPQGSVADGTIEVAVSAWADNAPLVASNARTVATDDPVIERGPLLDDRTIVSVGDGFAPWGHGDRDALCSPSEHDGAVVVACPGARSSDILERSQSRSNDGLAPTGPQLAYLADQPVDTVVVVVGAEDVGVSTLLQQCSDKECTVDDPSIQAALIAAQLIDLSRVYEQISARAGGGDGVHVLVGAYPQVFPADSAACAGFSAGEARAFATLFAALNVSIEASVNRARDRGVPVSFLPSPIDALRPDATLCADSPGVRVLDDGSLALTEDGGRAITDSILAGSVALESSPSDGDGERSVAISPERGLLDPLLSPTVVVRVDAGARNGDPLGTVLKPFQSVRIVGEGYQPGALVVATLARESTQPLAVGTAAQDGSVALAGVIPGSMTPGTVVVRVYGEGSGGQLLAGGVEAIVAAPVPDWIGSLGIMALLGLLAAGILFIVPRRVRPSKERQA